MEQFFDLIDDPWETVNLADDPRYADAVSHCRAKLFALEAQLRRRPLRQGRAREIVRRWAVPLKDAWAAHST